MSNISLMKDGTIEFEALENAKIVKKIYSKLVRDLQEELPKIPNKFTTQTTKTSTARRHATYPMSLSCQTYLKRLLKRFP